MAQAMWYEDEAVKLVATLTTLLKPVGFGVGITGSVSRGLASNHDVDIILYPLQKSEGEKEFGLWGVACRERARMTLRDHGMVRVRDIATMQAGWRARGSEDHKKVEEWSVGGKRVDIFWLS